jgi:hypothetical protein
MQRFNKLYPVLLSIVFVSWISVPLIYESFTKSKDVLISNTENRMLARRPVAKLTHLDPYPAAYEKFYNDHFFLRYELIHLNTLVVAYYLFNRSPVPAEVAFGSNGWLFTTSREREIYDGRFNLPDDFVEALADELHNRALEYRKQGITFYVTVAPMKCEIYPEFLPPYYARTSKPIFTDRIVAILRKDTLYHLIELKDSLLKAKEAGVLYYRTDNHWNGLGAYYAYSCIISRIRQDFPVIRPLARTDFTLAALQFSAGNLSTLAGLHHFIKEMMFNPRVLRPRAQETSKFGYRPPPRFGYPREYEIVRRIPDNSLPRIVVIRDSFFTSMIGLFSENFSQSLYIFDAWKYGPNYEIVDNEKPDIVLLEVFGPNLPNVLTCLARN